MFLFLSFTKSFQTLVFQNEDTFQVGGSSHNSREIDENIV